MFNSTELRTALVQTINKTAGTGKADKSGDYVIKFQDTRINKFECKLSLACLSCYNAAETNGCDAVCYQYDKRTRQCIEPPVFTVEKSGTVLKYCGVQLPL